MSHTSTYKHVITNLTAFVELAIERGYHVKLDTNVQLYGSNVIDNAQASIQIEGWRYPIAINQKGEIQYDHFGSTRDSMDNLHSLMQDYNEKVTLDSIPMDIVDNYSIETLENGDKEVILNYA